MSDAAIKAALEAAARNLCFATIRICGCLERCKTDRAELLRVWGKKAAAVEREAQEAKS